MSNIERLFGNDRAVPGIKSTGRVTYDHPEDTQDLLAGAKTAPATDTQPADGQPSVDTDAEHYPVAVFTPFRLGHLLTTLMAPGQPHAERLRQLRTELMLRFPADPGTGIAMAVIGAEGGEGRSSLSAQLAIAFAQLGRRTLLIDADLRKTGRADLFEGDVRDGLVDAIEQRDPGRFYGVEGVPMLSIMPAGGPPAEANPIELLSDGRFDRLVHELRGSFDIIIVDTPPFGLYADAQVVAAVIGTVLTVHRETASTYRATRAMIRQLISSQAQIIGAVLNHF